MGIYRNTPNNKSGGLAYRIWTFEGMGIYKNTPNDKSGGGWRIWTFEGRAGGFTVPSHWPLGQPAKVEQVLRQIMDTTRGKDTLGK